MKTWVPVSVLLVALLGGSGSADVESAELMKLPLNAPVANVYRSAVDNNDRIIMISNGIYRGDIVRVDMQLKS